MAEIPETPLEVAVALGRIEEGIKNMTEKIDKLVSKTESHESTLSRHEVDIELLKSRQAPRVHWLTILVGIVAVAGFALALLDRLFAA